MSDTDQMPEGTVADAVKGNWVDTLAPAWTRPYLRLSRADRPIGTWLLLLPCWWSLALAILQTNSVGLFDLWIAVSCAVGAFLMRGAGCTWNDISDRKIDAAVTRTKSRPIPSGQVTPRQAAVWMIIQALLAFGILLTFNMFAILLGIVSLIPVAIYPFAKRFTWWPQVFLGIAFNWGALLAWAAHHGSLSGPPVLLYLAGIAWTLFYDTIYAHQDKEDDALIGVKSTARLFGDNTPRALFFFFVAAVTLMGYAAVNATVMLDNKFVVLIGIAAAWLFGMHLSWQMRRLDINDPDNCLMLFRSNRDAGLIAAALLGVSALI